ncbi:MAG: chromosome segregation protein SMC [Bacilli bacterium]|nr:chromosome segregation protein SMC [Bacilli bacterium]
MYLKEIRAYGFKSFADKTVIEFGKNINGIVGPNGSGKSNIVDAVRWVLGEQSMKSLRGDTSLDVIFSGSESRKALNSASVTLVFNNEDKILPIDFNEVSIKRMAFRTGENEYYINNERVRLKDIVDLLTDSGTAKESFNIISQGKIDEILSNKPEDRRVIFEEAAGVLKYKKRKEEAIRKLDKTNQNLNRVNDIINELSTTIIPLEEASNKAKKYKEIKDRLSNIEVAVIAKTISDLNFEYQEGKKKIESLEDEISKISASSSTYDVDILKYKDKLKNIREKINSKQLLLIELSKQEEKITSDIKLFQERNKYSNETDKIYNNIISLKETIVDINNSLNNLNNEIDIINKKIEVINTNINNISSKNNELIVKKNNLNNLIIKNNRDIDSYKYKIEYLEDSLANNSSLPKPVKSILDNPKFRGVHNVISSLIDTDNKYSIAISTALGGASSYLVVDTPDNAKELMYYLKENNLGRATFYPLSVITSRNIDNDTLSLLNNEDGFIGVASNLVSYNSKYSNIIANVLGNVLIVDSIEIANIISNKINKRYKIVTLDGQVVNVGGSLTGGANIKSTSSLSIKYELEQINKNKELLDNKNKELLKEIEKIDKQINEINNELYTYKNNKVEYESKILTLKESISLKETDKLDKEKELKDLTNITNNTSEEDNLINMLSKTKEDISSLNRELSLLKVEEDNLNNNINELEETSRSSNSYVNKKEKELNSLNISINRIDVKLDTLLGDLTTDYNMTYDFAIENYKLDMDIEEARKEVNKLKDNLSVIGNVNPDAPEEYEKASTRYEFLKSQKEDLVSAENTLYDIIKEMDTIMKSKLTDTFELVRKEFRNVYRELFKGGRAELYLTDPDNILETGIEIKAEPPGKKLQSISLLSGGEKTFTAISLLFAILNIRPVPFCLFDEVEAALDDANVEAFGKYLDKYRDNTQFIIITHKKKTMEYADILYGITMQESGVSKIVSVKLEDIDKK